MKQTVQEIFAAAERLPLKLRKQLAERLNATTIVEASATVIYLNRFPAEKQARFTLLMDKNNEGQLSRAEKLELKKLVAENDRLMLENSRALALAVQPELFDKRGRPIRARFQNFIATRKLALNPRKVKVGQKDSPRARG